jgi:DNA transposition AAA+ family ATPase
MSNTPETPDATLAKIAPAVKPFTPALRDALEEYRKERGLSLAQLGRQLQCSDATVSNYLTKKPLGNVAKLEAIIADVLKAAANQTGQKTEFFETAVSRQFFKVCDTIRKTGDVGMIHGEAGVGKTSSAEAYRVQHPSSILATFSRWHAPRQHRKGDVNGIESLIFQSIENTGWNNSMRRAPFMVDRLKGSNRLILIDNVHRLHTGGLQWIFDFHDATGCPVAMVGNPEVLDIIRRSDQMFSRIGLMREMKLDGGKSGASAMESATEEMLRQFVPDQVEELKEIALKVVRNQGHLRTLKKHLLLLPEILEAAKGDYVAAFHVAHQQLVTDYSL